MDIILEGEYITYVDTGIKRETKSKWIGIRAKEKPFSATGGNLVTEILGQGVELVTQKGAAVFSIVAEIKTLIDNNSIDTLYRTISQEALYEEYSVPAFRTITGKRGYPKVETTTLSNNAVRTGVSKWHIYHSYPESGKFKRYTDPNNNGQLYYGE